MTCKATVNIPDTSNLLTLAEQEIHASGAELAGAYRKATRALVKHFPSGRLLFTDFNLRTLRDWIAAMLCGGASLQTVLYYLENVAALYNKAVKLGHAPKTDSFRILKAELLDTKGETLSRTVKDSLGALSRLAKGRARITDGMQYYADLLLFSFYCRGLSIPSILALPADLIPAEFPADNPVVYPAVGSGPAESAPSAFIGLPPEAMAIAEKYKAKRREKLFPRGAVETVEKRVKMIAHHIGLDTPPDMTVGEITSRLWILAALRIGIPAGTIARCRLPESPSLAILDFARKDDVSANLADASLEGASEASRLDISEAARLCASETSHPCTSEAARIEAAAADLPDAEIVRITRQVADSVTYNPLHWHVMKLRPHHTYEEVRDRLNTAKFKHIDYFYPQEEISRRIGKKLEFQHKPVLPYVLFFRSKDTDIAPMFKHIGDIAWCYRNTPRGAYAVVPPTEMMRFQRTIGSFTPDLEVSPLGTTPVIGIGQMVRVTGGPMAGYEGEVYEILDDPAAPSAAVPSASSSSSSAASSAASATSVKLFRLKVMADNGIEWKMTIDSRQLEPIGESSLL